ncbi:hypothetical protein LVY74_16670 [Acinetobacter sp. ME22]|uniref:hypothetical protein n=1 Tax=Acinetobacter sp. ME22 TaxID=2904802 RepID=UPI001ED9C82F|nr:hypothetical protein [Acinetobacter sp. ME22]MCG2575172.1 hypothetical protein [Acinetobacter sp. ME22]
MLDETEIKALTIELTKFKISKLEQGAEDHKITAELLIKIYQESKNEIQKECIKYFKYQPPRVG